MFIGRVAGGLLAAPLVARAQKPAMQAIGFVSSASRAQWTSFVSAFRQGLNEVGYIEGKNFGIEFRWAEGHYDRLPALAQRPAWLATLSGCRLRESPSLTLSQVGRGFALEEEFQVAEADEGG